MSEPMYTEEEIREIRAQLAAMTPEEREAEQARLREKMGISEETVAQMQRLVKIETVKIQENHENGGKTGELDQEALDGYLSYVWAMIMTREDHPDIQRMLNDPEAMFRAAWAMGFDIGEGWRAGLGL